MSEKDLLPSSRSRKEKAAETTVEYGDNENPGTSANAIARLLLYRGAESHDPKYDTPEWYGHELHITDIHHCQAEYLYRQGMSSTASILDIGCGDGSTLLNFPFNYGHRGDLTGINLSPSSYAYGEHIAKEWEAEQKKIAVSYNQVVDIPNIRFKKGNAMDLQPAIKGRKFDVALLNFLLYLLPESSKAIDEALEATRDDGFLSIATRSEDNLKVKWKENVPKIAQFLSTETPVTPYKDYDINRLDAEMEERGLDLVASYKQDEDITIIPADFWLYAYNHEILKDLFKYPEPREIDGIIRETPTNDAIKEAVEEIVIKPAMKKLQQDPNYRMHDWVHQEFRIYRKRQRKIEIPSKKLVLPSGLLLT